MYFSISAPQNVTLPDGRVLSFRVNPVDTSLCELHVVGADHNDAQGTHVLTFKRNGSIADQSFLAAPAPAVAAPAPDEDIPGTPVPVPPVPYADAPSVDQDAVRANSWPDKGIPRDRGAPPAGKVNTTDTINRGYATPGDSKPAA